MHLLDESFGNNQPQASAPWLSRQRVVYLAEGFEQRLLLRAGQPDAGIGDA